MRSFTVGQLRKLISTLPDEVHLVVSASDHEYRTASPEVTTALWDYTAYTQDFGEKVTPQSEYGKRIQVLHFY